MEAKICHGLNMNTDSQKMEISWNVKNWIITDSYSIKK